jgi:hypothetical protein
MLAFEMNQERLVFWNISGGLNYDLFCIPICPPAQPPTQHPFIHPPTLPFTYSYVLAMTI